MVKNNRDDYLKMTAELMLLVSAAASIAFIHTLMGPDHYLPFVAMGKARGWSLPKDRSDHHRLWTWSLGWFDSAGPVWHLGWVSHLPDLEMIEGVRGDLAAWALMSFGILYMIWGIQQGHSAAKATVHMHTHADGTVHAHHHDHDTGHAHVHESACRQNLHRPLDHLYHFRAWPMRATNSAADVSGC